MHQMVGIVPREKQPMQERIGHWIVAGFIYFVLVSNKTRMIKQIR